MSHTNNLVSFLRHYGPIPASDNMYDELIQTEVDRLGIDPAIQIPPARLQSVLENLDSAVPRSVILTGTAGDGKTYHCRRVFETFGGSSSDWQRGEKIVTLNLPKSGKSLTIVKDLSELTRAEKDELIPGVAAAVTGKDETTVYLIAANDGQLVASWRDWSEAQDEEAHRIFRKIEDMLIEDRVQDDTLQLDLHNLSRLDAAQHFQDLVAQIVNHPQWTQCEGCELLDSDGKTTCPIRINRERLQGANGDKVFRDRIGALLTLSRANRMHLPIRDLLLLGANILLGDRKPNQVLLTCRTARNRAKENDYRLTNPYANVFGVNLPERQRSQYQVFTTLEAFGIGRETDNKFDNLLIYGPYGEFDSYDELIASDDEYGTSAYKPYLDDYLNGERERTDEFMKALSRQRQRLFFSMPSDDAELNPWHLTVYQSSGMYLQFVADLASGVDVSRMVELLIRGLNRTFCGMMIDDGTELYLASSGGDGRGRIASLLNYELRTSPHRRDPYVTFRLVHDQTTPRLVVIDPASRKDNVIDFLDVQLTHFEYLVRVAGGSLPASFSRQCHEDFLDFKLRLIERLDDLIGEPQSPNEVNLQAMTVDKQGRVQPDNIRIRVAS
jgi:hypothetical protein